MAAQFFDNVKYLNASFVFVSENCNNHSLHSRRSHHQGFQSSLQTLIPSFPEDKADLGVSLLI